ncbi:MAG: ferrochelatase [Acidobacteria bacterium]|nr:ferrochelatase [Acidobacteriota bacterium]
MWIRRLLVHLIIVPRRREASARLYRSIWTAEGSPLVTNTRALAAGLRERLGPSVSVAIGMRYGQPSIEVGMAELLAVGASRILALPLYPQYAESSYETAVVATREAATRLGCHERLQILPVFYDRTEYLEACVANLREPLARLCPEHLLFSYHSLPVRHIERLDRTRAHCLRLENCCDQITEVNRDCYRAHCLATSRGIAARLGLAAQDWSISFQSRLGRAAWLGPQTEDHLRELVQAGVRRVAVTCPSFVADCLETLEEIGVRARKVFLEAGGEDLTLLPALNAHPAWQKSVLALTRDLKN